MIKILRQVRTAISHLNPEQVRRVSERPIRVGLIASSPGAYADMEDFLLGTGVPEDSRDGLRANLHRAADNGPDEYDLALYEQGLACPREGFTYFRDNPEKTFEEIASERSDILIPLARNFPGVRKPIVDGIVKKVAKENALFTLTTALPNVLPSVLELPWAVGEFASDTAFLTMNQVRMAFLVAAATGKPVGYVEQKIEIGSILASAFGWRALARELAGKIPLGGGLVAKAAISYAGTYVVGKGLETFHEAGRYFSREERKRAYEAAYRDGRAEAERMMADQGLPAR